MTSDSSDDGSDAKKTGKAGASNPFGTGPGGLFDSDLAGAVKESAQQIWLAGMGAFAKAQAEGTKVFETLVKEGASLQRKTQAAAEEKFGAEAGKFGAKFTGMAGDVGARAGQQWDKLEAIFEERTAKALSRLGVPSSKDIEALSQRIDALTAQVAQLSERAATASAKKPRVRAAKAVSAGTTRRAAPRKPSST
jgi:poly(hydroxyalkanoate) granule-associated protein